MIFSEISKQEYPSDYEGYFTNLESNTELLSDLEASHHYFIQFVQNIPMDKFDYRYAPDKWTIKEIIQHLIDVERMMSYSALSLSRNNKNSIPIFDNNPYVVNSGANNRHLKDLLMEFSLVRHSTLALFRSFSKSMFHNRGIVGGNVVSVRALGYFILAHQYHHKGVFQARYLDGTS